MNIKEAYDFMFSLEAHGTKLGLEKISEILEKLGNPQDKLKIIHVAGTNGKGSVCAMLSQILREHGYNVGVYTSPHLISFNERITINGKNITDEEILDTYKKVKLHYNNQTFFEFVTALALTYFSQNSLDYVILEVGLGGRLDATNVVDPLLSIITNIDLEHTEYLGKTIAEITFEKGGIIKHNIPVIIGKLHDNAKKVIEKICKEHESSLFYANDYKLLNNKLTVGNHNDLSLSLKGSFQFENAALVISSIDILNEIYNFNVTENEIKTGLRNTKWRGRFEFISKNILIDCAHNPAGAFALSKELKKIDHKKMILLTGIMVDKDKLSMLKNLVPFFSKIITTKATIMHSESAEKLCEEIKSISSVKCTPVDNVELAVKTAKDKLTDESLLVVAGSIYLLRDAIKYL